MKAIQTKFLPCTNTKGSRVKAFDQDGNQVTLSWNRGLDSTKNHESAAVALCHKMNRWRKKDSMGRWFYVRIINGRVVPENMPGLCWTHKDRVENPDFEYKRGNYWEQVTE